MIWLIAFGVLVLTAILGVQLYWVWMFKKAQQQHLQEMKENNRPTMWDVREVLKGGDRDLAVQLYCEVFGIDDIERARREVDEIERGMRR
ncbi:MAG: hypothetical protein HGA80_08895 [Candidatus Omnitrophica bacterium]|nr:hypothetical protein [Candidatus Omnitrophota bacterium]